MGLRPEEGERRPLSHGFRYACARRRGFLSALQGRSFRRKIFYELIHAVCFRRRQLLTRSPTMAMLRRVKVLGSGMGFAVIGSAR